MRFFSAGMYFNTTVSSPLYCIVVSRFSSIYRKRESVFGLDVRDATKVNSRPYLGLQSVPLLYLGVKLPGIKGQLHLSQESVLSEAIVVPHRDLQTSSLQLRVADYVL